MPIVGEIFSKLSCDLVVPLLKSDKGNKYMFTTICVSSKYPETIPIPDMKSETIVDALILLFRKLGFPKELQSNLGKSFTSYLMTVFLKMFGIKIEHSSMCRPKSNSLERWNRSVKRLLTVLRVENESNWEANLPYTLLALKTVMHNSTGFSSAELVHGINLRTPETLLWME